MNYLLKNQKLKLIKTHLQTNLLSFSSMASFSNIFNKKKNQNSFYCLTKNRSFSYSFEDQKLIRNFLQTLDLEIEKHSNVLNLSTETDLNKMVLKQVQVSSDFYMQKGLMESYLHSYVLLQLLKQGFSSALEGPNSLAFRNFISEYKLYFSNTHFNTHFILVNERPILFKLLFENLTELDLIKESQKNGNDPLYVFECLIQNVTLDSKEQALFFGTPSDINTTKPLIIDSISSSLETKTSSLNEIMFSSLPATDFLLNSFGFLIITILSGAVLLRDRLMKLLILMEVLFLILIIGFTLQHESLFMSPDSTGFGILLIALAACEAVLGLSLIIMRTRVLATYLTTKTNIFIKFIKNKFKIL